MSKATVSIDGLLAADATMIAVLTQDVLHRAVLSRMDPGTLCDLLTISTVETGLPRSLRDDFQGFREKMMRDLRDLPDGPALIEWAHEMGEVAPQRVPRVLRDWVASLVAERKVPDVVSTLHALLDRWTEVEPNLYVVPSTAEARTKPRVRTVEAPARAPREPRRSATPPAMVDDRRAEWIATDLLDRLGRYGADGLKEAILVAGCRHRSPWDGLTDDEVLTVLRRLGRENKVKKTAERWIRR